MPRQTAAGQGPTDDMAASLRQHPAKAPMPASASEGGDEGSHEGGVHLERRGSIQDPDALARQRIIKRIFYTIFICEMVINFDSGAVPAVLEQIKSDFVLEPWELGLLGGLQYIGLVIMSPFAGMLLQKYPTKVVLGASLFANLAFVLMLANANSKFLLLFSRLGIGITQTTPCVYAPVWVDEFASHDCATVWMSVLQAGVPLGVMLGYAVAGAIVNNGGHWTGAIWFQAAVLIPICVGSLFTPPHLLNVTAAAVEAAGAGGAEEGGAKRGSTAGLAAADANNAAGGGADSADFRSRTDSLADIVAAMPRGGRGRCDSLWMYTEEGGGASAAKLSMRRQLKVLLRSKTFVNVTLGLCALYFVVTGIQFWMTDYLVQVIKAPYGSVLGAFAATSATGPVFGVVFGGWFIDRVGGYHGLAGRAKTSFYCAVFGCIAVFFAIPAAFVKSFSVLITLVWFVLFWGGAIIPGATGLLLASVNADLRQFSSAMSMLMYNIGGYAAGTIFPGLVMQAAEDSYLSAGEDPEPAYIDALTLGMRLIFFWALFGGGFITWAAVVARRDFKAAAERAAARKARRAKKTAELKEREARNRAAESKVTEGGPPLPLPLTVTAPQRYVEGVGAAGAVGAVAAPSIQYHDEGEDSSDEENLSHDQWHEVVLYETSRQRAQTGAGIMPGGFVF